MITAVIVNFNAGPLLARSVAAASAAGARVVVVDNASTDASLAALEGQPVTLLRNARNRGFAAACNQGAALATSAYVLFLNPDCLVTPATLALVRQALEARPGAAMAGCLVLNEDGSEQRGCRRRIPDPARSFFRLSGLSGRYPERFPDFNDAGLPLPAGPASVEAISGAFMLVRRDVLDALGGWDEGYFLHCEDLDLCQRMRDAGHDVLFVPEAVATHLQGASSRSRPIRVEWHKHRGMWRFYRKFQAGRRPAPLNALVAAGIACHFALEALRLAPRSLRLALAR